jgi:hypothetical protein
MSKKWMGLCSMAVVMMLVAAGGCSKKKEAAESEPVSEVDTPPAETATTSAAGMYMAELPAADAAGRSIMLMLNDDNTASMSVDMMNGQPAVVENGTWAMNATSGVDVTLQRDVSGTMVSSMMGFAVMGDTLSLNNPVEAGYGAAGLKLVKSAAGEEHAH